MTTNTPAQPHADTQALRRTKYGLNTAVAVLAALGLAVFVNLIAFHYLKRLRPLDLTAAGKYSLSPQTRKVLSQLTEDYRIVTLFGMTDPTLEPADILEARDLIDQYARFSDRIHVEHIAFGRETARLEKFLRSLTERYQDQLQPLQSALDQARQSLQDLRTQLAHQKTLLTQALSDPQLPTGQLRQLLTSVAQIFARWDQELEARLQESAQFLSSELPDYLRARETLEGVFSRAEQNFSVLISEFDKAASAPETPDALKDRLLVLADRFRESRAAVQPVLTQLKNAPTVSEYDQLRQQILSNPNPLVLIGPRQVRVLWLGNMFRPPDPAKLAPGENPEKLFQGEEHITGALLAMTLKQPPLVVFISTSSRPALGPGGEFSLVAERLQNLRFEVQSWNPGAFSSPAAPAMPSPPPPQPKPDQTVVWVLLPDLSTGPMAFAAGSAQQQAVDFLKERLDKGESALLIVGASQAVRFGGSSPVLSLLESWGIRAQLDRIIYRPFSLPDGRTQAVSFFRVTDWDASHPVVAALSGLRAAFVQASPLDIQPTDAVQLTPLVRLTGRQLWADNEFDSSNPRPDPTDPTADSFTIALAAQHNNSRLIVVADPYWAHDYITTNADDALRREGVGLAEIFGSAYPANAEMFVNCIHWLAHLDNLIAASARTQDIRRIQPMTLAAFLALRWSLLIALPAAAALTGLVVWWTRTRT